MMRVNLTVIVCVMVIIDLGSTQFRRHLNLLSILNENDTNYDFWTAEKNQEKTSPRNGKYIKLSMLHLLYNIIGSTGHSPKSLERARQLNKLQEEVPWNVPFPCDTNNTRSKKTPTSVFRVRPGDIDVVAAVGDSLVAANGAVSTNIFQVLIANRGVSWAIGGQDTWRKYLTLPNILKEFNPNIIGYSTGDSLYSANIERSQLNAAEPGARTKDLVKMTDTLIKRIKAHPRINIQKDWKMVTIFVGAMDFCFGMCNRENPYDILEEHRKHLTESLNKLRDNLPRTIVNVVQQINLGDIIPKFSGLPWLCNTVYKPYECPCLVEEQFKNLTSVYISIMHKWQQVEFKVVSNPKYQNLNDFVVIVQPFLVNTKFPQVKTANGVQTDLRYLSQDCFHLSQLGHAKAANALWNNIMEPPGKKSTTWEMDFLKLKCPTEENPYIPVRRLNKPNIFAQKMFANDVNLLN